MSSPKVSICVPIHKTMKHGDFFLWRLVQSLMSQTYTNYELIITQEGRMAENTNAAMQKATGDLIKILYLDDYFAHKDALKNIVEAFTPETQWLATGCLHQDSSPETLEEPHSPHYPTYTHDIHRGNNRIGSPSVVTLRNKTKLMFDEKLSFLLDCDLYKRYHTQFGTPTILNDLNVVIGIHPGQTSNTMRDKEKQEEFIYMQQKHG